MRAHGLHLSSLASLLLPAPAVLPLGTPFHTSSRQCYTHPVGKAGGWLGIKANHGENTLFQQKGAFVADEQPMKDLLHCTLKEDDDFAMLTENQSIILGLFGYLLIISSNFLRLRCF